MEDRQIIAEPLTINKVVSNLSDEEWDVALKRYHVIPPIIINVLYKQVRDVDSWCQN
jgi:hypothetical protein